MEVLPAGATGELVLTTLTKEALPMIRYRTRDITRLIDEPCACGRTHRRMMRVTGRSDDMLIIRGVNVYPSQVEAHLVGFPGACAALPARAHPRRGHGRHDDRGRARDTRRRSTSRSSPSSATDVRNHIKTMVGVTCDVVLKAPGEVPRSQGKAVRVKDLRQTSKP